MPFLGFLLGPWGKLAMAAAVVAALYGWHRVQVWQADRAGYARAVTDIERANEAAGRKADAATITVRECHARGEPWIWNRETGKCEKP